jgi:hypothetical protein
MIRKVIKRSDNKSIMPRFYLFDIMFITPNVYVVFHKQLNNARISITSPFFCFFAAHLHTVHCTAHCTLYRPLSTASPCYFWLISRHRSYLRLWRLRSTIGGAVHCRNARCFMRWQSFSTTTNLKVVTNVVIVVYIHIYMYVPVQKRILLTAVYGALLEAIFG